MKDIIFKRTELEDKEIMTKYFDEHPAEVVNVHLSMCFYGPGSTR